MSGRVFITESAIADLHAFADGSRPLETGGVLVGVLRDTQPWITSVVEIRDPLRTSTRYVIPSGATPLAVELARERDARVGYIGDWHSHPADLPVSGTDQTTLRRNARKRKSRRVATILFVIRDAAGGWQIEAMGDDGQTAWPIELVMTGDLAAVESQRMPAIVSANGEASTTESST